MFRDFYENQEVRERVEGISRGLFGNTEPIPGARNMEGLSNQEVEHMANGTARDRKDGSVLALQLAVDEYLEGEVDGQIYSEIKEQSVENVLEYYQGGEVTEIKAPETKLETRESGLSGDEVLIEKWYDELDYHENEVDTVIAVASGGLEPGIVAAEKLNANLDIVRYSSDRDDETVKEVDTEPEYGNVLIVDDTSFSGESLETVRDCFEPRSDSVETEAVIEGNLDKAKSFLPLFTRRRWKYTEDN